MEKGPSRQELEAARERQEQLEYEQKLTKKTTWPNRAERRRQWKSSSKKRKSP